MAINVRWGNDEKTFTIFEFIHPWTWDEYHECRKEAMALVETVPHTVNIITDFSKGGSFPGNALSYFGTSVDQTQRPFDVCVVVTSSNLINMMANVLTKVKTRIKFSVVKSLDDALVVMREYEIEKSR